MPDVATSLHLRNVNELLLRLPVKGGFVDYPDQRVTYATRLHKVLTLLFGLSQDSYEHSLMPVKNFVDILHNIYHFNYGVAERLQQSQLILSATFDSSWESYFHNLVDHIGPFLDTVFCHCIGFEGRSCADGYEAFADFIREHQVQTGMLYSATPELTVNDLRTLKRTRFGDGVQEPGVSEETEQEMLETDQIQWSERYRSPQWQNEPEYKRLRLLSLERFFRSVWELRRFFPSSERIDGWRSAQDVYDDAATRLAEALKKSAIKQDANYLREAAANALLYGRDVREALDAMRWFVTLGLLTAEEALAALKEMQVPADVAATVVAQQRTFKVPSVVTAIDTSSVQVDILKEVGSTKAILTLARLPTTGRRNFMRKLRAALDGVEGMHVNVAFTYDGLRRAGLEPETLELFPKEFQEGMEQRGAVFGDYGWPNHFDYWSLRGRSGAVALTSIDLVIVVHCKEALRPERLPDLVKRLHAEWFSDERDSCVVHVEDLGGVPEPFAFKHADVISQPEVHLDCAMAKSMREDSTQQADTEPPPYTNEIAVGDVVLGHADHRGFVAGCASDAKNPASSALFRNGTFLVLRKLAQNPAAYFEYLKEFQVDEHVTLGPPRKAPDSYDGPSNEDFPRVSHRRRSNPRRPGSPRIVRRSFRYSGASSGNDAGTRDERGHMFMCYNASIAEQFEVIQRWINGGNSTGLLSSKIDLVAGQHVPQGLTEKLTRVPHVTVRWGLYAFVPSRVAMELMTNLVPDSAHGVLHPWPALRDADECARIRRGRKLLSELDAIKDAETARLSWKELFETHEAGRDARAVWAAIRDDGGRKDTPYGFLVADPVTAQAVLSDDARFSVSEYRKRFREAGFDFYLGSDHTKCPYKAGAGRSYEVMSKANGYLRETLKANVLFEDARKSASDYLVTMESLDGIRNRSMRFNVRDLARWVVGNISNQHIGIPRNAVEKGGSLDRSALSDFLDNFNHMTHYASFPHPEGWVAQRAVAAGEALRRAYDGDSFNSTAFGRKLLAEKYDAIDPTSVRDAIIIANIGFVPPALSMLTLMLTKWLGDGDIEHAQLRDQKHAYAAVLKDLRQNSTFTTMYRTALEGNGLTAPGRFVVVGIQSAMAVDLAASAASPERWMFGGEYKQTAHGCPMRDGALHILAGAVMALASYVHDQARAGRQLTASGPLTYRFETVGRVLPGHDRPAPLLTT